MGWDEALFGWIWKGAKSWKRRPSAEVRAREVKLEEVRDRLAILASAIAERKIDLREAEDEGGAGGDVVLLPASMSFAPSRDDNARAYVLRVAYSSTSIRLGYLARSGWGPREIERASVIALPATLLALFEELPSIEPEWRRIAALAPGVEPRLATLVGSLSQDGLRKSSVAPAALGEALLAPFEPGQGAAVHPLIGTLRPVGAALEIRAGAGSEEALPTGRERAFRARERVVSRELGKSPEQDNPLVHSFEKIHTLEEHGGGSKRADGEDELDAHGDALDDLDLREVVRTEERAGSLLRADLTIDGGVGDVEGEPEGQGIRYDEWDERSGRYRPEWCLVREENVPRRIAPADAARFVVEVRARRARDIDALRRTLETVDDARRWRPRQLDGGDIDEDAVVDRHAALASGHTPPDRLYRARRRAAPELAALLLVDASLSTDGWVSGRRVLDVEVETAVTLAEGLEGHAIELGLAAFSSRTRKDCRFRWIKRLDEPWAGASVRVASLVPEGYTRIGPALRHATAALAQASARHRVLLLVTDGKPSDYDRYEGRYGIADVRQAVREAERERTLVHALAVDKQASLHLPRMFGRGCYHVLREPGDLPRAAIELCARMLRAR